MAGNNNGLCSHLGLLMSPGKISVWDSLCGFVSVKIHGSMVDAFYKMALCATMKNTLMLPELPPFQSKDLSGSMGFLRV